MTPAVHRAHDLSQELIVDDFAVAIGVKSFENGLDLKAIVCDTVASEGLLKFLAVERARAVVVHDLERLAEVEDAASSACLDAFPHTVDEFVVCDELLLSVFLLGSASVTLSLNIDTLIRSKVTGISATSCSHLVMDHLAFLSWPGTLIRHAMGKHTVFRLAVEDLVVLILPLLAAILAPHITGLASTEFCLAHRYKIHAPNADKEILKLNVPLEVLIHELMVLAELGASDVLVSAEVVVRVVEGGEHLKECETALLRGLDTANDIRVTLSHKAVLHLVHLEDTVTIGIELVESFIYETLAERV